MPGDLRGPKPFLLPQPPHLIDVDARLPALVDALDAIRAVLEAGGVEFTNADQPGVRLKPKGRCAAGR